MAGTPGTPFPVLAEYIRPNVYPRKSNCPSGSLQIRVFSSLTVSFSLPMISRSRRLFGFASPAQDHEIVGVGHDARAEASLQPEHLSIPARTGACRDSPAMVRWVS